MPWSIPIIRMPKNSSFLPPKRLIGTNGFSANGRAAYAKAKRRHSLGLWLIAYRQFHLTGGSPNPNVLRHQKSLNAEKNVDRVGASRKPSLFVSEKLGFVPQPSIRAVMIDLQNKPAFAFELNERDRRDPHRDFCL